VKGPPSMQDPPCDAAFWFLKPHLETNWSCNTTKCVAFAPGLPPSFRRHQIILLGDRRNGNLRRGWNLRRPELSSDVLSVRPCNHVTNMNMERFDNRSNIACVIAMFRNSCLSASGQNSESELNSEARFLIKTGTFRLFKHVCRGFLVVSPKILSDLYLRYISVNYDLESIVSQQTFPFLFFWITGFKNNRL